jgi:hypothetical protein
LAIGQKNWLSTASTNVQTVALSSLAASLSPRFLSPARLVWSLLIFIASPKDGLVQGFGTGEMNTMKITLFALCFFCAASALGQSAGGSVGSASMSSSIQMTSHPQHAAQAPMALEESLFDHSGYFIVEGERPLWEVQPLSPKVPLGDIARALRKEHDTAKKAEFVRND